MKNAHEQRKGVEKGNQTQAISKNLKFDRYKGIAFYVLLSKEWFPSITVGLLTTVLGIIGILRTANANELPERLNLKLGDEVMGQSHTNHVNPAHKESLKDAVASRRANANASGVPSATAPLDATEKNTDIQILNVPPKPATYEQIAEVPVPSTDPERDWRLINNWLQAPEFIPRNSQSPVSPTGTVSQNDPPATDPGITLAPNEVRILTPQSGVITSRSTNLVVQYNADTQIQVSINQKPLDPSTSTQQERDAAKNILTQVWYNIPLQKGENTITVQAGNGTPSSIQLTVKETAAQRIEITPVGDPRVPADGRSLLTFNGRITDENGQLITEDVLVTLTSSAGKFVGADQDKDRPGFQVIARAGQFTAQLQSGLEAQKVRIRAATDLKVEGRNVEGSNQSSNLPNTSGSSTGNGLSSGVQPTNQQPSSTTRMGTDARINTDNSSVYPSSNPSGANLQHSTLLEAYTQVEFITNLRPSLVSGVVSLRIGSGGTNFWGRRSEFLNPDTINDGTQFDLSGAVFATGKVGEWLFTGAYNSDRPLNENCDGITRLFQGPQFCEQQYPVYGDSSTVDYLTPSTDSVYLRFERTSPVRGAEPDYIMWGDYNTEEFARTSQLFTATTRQLHGFKGNYNLGNLQFTALYSQDIQGFQRDTIQPNGTSGYYFVSRRLLIPGSENVFLETEELNRPGTVIERKPLSRGPDYEIDYDRGTLLFRRPILATEFVPFTTDTGAISQEGSTVLVRRIVVTYQYDNAEAGDARLYAGRVQYNFSNEFNLESWIAATYLREDQGGQDFELYGADFRIPLGHNGQLIGEYAHSFNNSIYLGGITGSAYRLEANGTIIRGLSGRAYYRSVEENFANNATTSFTPGQTRYGAAIAYKLGTTTSIQVGYDHEVNFGIAPAVRTDLFDLFNPGVEAAPGSRVDNSLTTIRAGIEQQIGSATVGIDYVNRSRADRISNVFTGDASQIVSRLGIPLTESLTFRAQNELNLGSSDPLYPNRTTFGVDWTAYPGVTLRLAHQFFDGGLLGSDSITSFDTIVERQLGENTSITGRYSVISGFNTITGQGAVGLRHNWVIAPGLRVGLGYEHIFSNTLLPTAAGVRFAQPYAVGQSASSLGFFGGDAYSIGVEYTDNPDFKASARFEYRTGSGNDNTVFSIAAAGKISPSLTALARYEQANFSNQLIEGLGNTATLRLGLAYRDLASDRWNGLLRYEYRQNPSTIPDTLLIGSSTSAIEHLFALETIYAPSWRWEFYGKGALRHSTSYLADDFSNSSTVFLSQLRASYRLGYRMDLAVEGRWIGQSSPSYNEFGVAVETGYYLTPDLRLGVGYSFGSVDDRDFTGYRSQGGPYFSLIFKVNELFGGFGRQRVVPPQQQESRVKPIASGDKPAEPSAVNTTSTNEPQAGANQKQGENQSPSSFRSESSSSPASSATPLLLLQDASLVNEPENFLFLLLGGTAGQ